MKKLNIVLVLSFAFFHASIVQAQNTSGANNAALSGDYAFAFNGFIGGGSGTFAFVGRFTADGAGNISDGELDSNAVSAGHTFTAQPFTGTYTIGSDNRGTMTLNVDPNHTPTFAFAMTADGNARFIAFGVAGPGTIGSGRIEKEDTTAFNTASIMGDYAFGLAGFDPSNRRVAFVGRLTADGAGNFSNGAGDVNATTAVGPVTFTNATYTVSDTTSGRGTIALGILFNGLPSNLNFVFYIVNSGTLFAMETDAVTALSPLLNGAVLKQQAPAGGFSNASLNGGMVLSLTGFGVQSSGAPPVPKAVVGLLTADGNGGYNLTFDENWGGVLNSATGLSGTYSVSQNGRASIVIRGSTEIAYLVSSNQVFFLATGNSVLFGPGDAQASGAFTNSSVTGNYTGWATTPAASGVTVFSGEFSADGASPTGNLTGTEDICNSGGLTSGQAFAATYSVSSSPTNGRGAVTITSASGASAVAYVISPSKFVILPLSDPNPSVWLFEQPSPASPPPTVSLSSLTLEPTTVVGGAQSSTGTVTLSGPAPSGGAQVDLSSSNTAAAQVPSSVTVPAGATSATFTINTSIVLISTSVNISASYNGTIQTATLGVLL